MAARAEQLKVAELVAATVAERDTVMHLQPALGVAPDANTVA
jgi:hypothetical protein